jgi:hypothetical protein
MICARKVFNSFVEKVVEKTKSKRVALGKHKA